MPDRRDHHVDARPAQLRQRNQLGAGQAAVAVEARPRSHQRQRLRDRAAFGLEVVGAPQHQRDRLRHRLVVGGEAFEQHAGLARPVGDGEGAGNAERIEAVQVAPGRQDRRRAQQVAARRGAHEAAVERVQDRGQLVVVLHQAIGLRQFLEHGQRASRRRAAPPRPTRRAPACRARWTRSRHAAAAGRARRRPARPACRCAVPRSAPGRPRAGRAG